MKMGHIELLTRGMRQYLVMLLQDLVEALHCEHCLSKFVCKPCENCPVKYAVSLVAVFAAKIWRC